MLKSQTCKILVSIDSCEFIKYLGHVKLSKLYDLKGRSVSHKLASFRLDPHLLTIPDINRTLKTYQLLTKVSTKWWKVRMARTADFYSIRLLNITFSFRFNIIIHLLSGWARDDPKFHIFHIDQSFKPWQKNLEAPNKMNHLWITFV